MLNCQQLSLSGIFHMSRLTRMIPRIGKHYHTKSSSTAGVITQQRRASLRQLLSAFRSNRHSPLNHLASSSTTRRSPQNWAQQYDLKLRGRRQRECSRREEYFYRTNSTWFLTGQMCMKRCMMSPKCFKSLRVNRYSMCQEQTNSSTKGKLPQITHRSATAAQ
jgi:hypothetical protein